MARPPRIHVPGGFYHATLRGNHRQDIFEDQRDRVLLNTIVARAIEKHNARIHAFCWMTNHLHFLVQVSDTPLGRLMQQIGSEYARAFQQRLATTGHLFENRHFATLIDTDSYLLEAIRYVHQNPVRAGLMSSAANYRWSSHAAYMGGTDELWVTTDFALALFSNDRARAVVLYRAFIDAIPASEIAVELATLERGAPLLGKRDAATPPVTAPPGSTSLAAIVSDGCRHFAVPLSELRSPLRISRLVAARAWITQTATQCGVATIAEIARELNRDESTLRSAMKRYVERDSDADNLGLRDHGEH